MKMFTTHTETRMIYRGSITAAHGGMILRTTPCPCPKCYDIMPHARTHVVASLDNGFIVAHAHASSFHPEAVEVDEWGERPRLNIEQIATRFMNAIKAKMQMS